MDEKKEIIPEGISVERGSDMANPESSGKSESSIFAEEKEGVGESSKEKEHFYSQILSKIKTTTSSSDGNNTVSDEAEVLSKEKGVEDKVVKLVNIAEDKGVVYAVKVAKHLEDNYILDELHDRLLSEELHKALLEKGLIKDI